MYQVRSRCRQGGMVLPLLAIGMLAIIGIVGLSMDVGHAFLNKTRLQNSLDSAALSGARTLMLSNDVDTASADAREAFREHLNGEMASLDVGHLTLQYSDTLVPFVAGGNNPRFVRAALEGFTSNLSFSAVLPDVDGSMSIAGSAVAGPIPVGYPGDGEACDIAPLLVCGLPGDSNCSDGSCFNYSVGGQTEYQLKLGSAVESDVYVESESEYSAVRVSNCGEGSIFYNCVPADEIIDPSGSGGGNGLRKFVLNRLPCADDYCIRKNLAGSFDSCMTQGPGVRTQHGVTIAPILEGLMTRFGVHRPPLGAADFPSDVVVTDRIENLDYWYDNYKHDVESIIVAGTSGNGGTPYRRVATVPVVSCRDDAGGVSAINVLGFLCFYLTRNIEPVESDGHIYGQFVKECEASGEQGESMQSLSNSAGRPMEIVLYKDPDSQES